MEELIRQMVVLAREGAQRELEHAARSVSAKLIDMASTEERRRVVAFLKRNVFAHEGELLTLDEPRQLALVQAIASGEHLK